MASTPPRDSPSQFGSRGKHGEAPSQSIGETLWSLRVPLRIIHTHQPPGTPAFITSVPRMSYLALLVPRLNAYYETFSQSDQQGEPGDGVEPVQSAEPLQCSSFHHDSVLLRNLPVGLLVDLYYQPSPSPPQPCWDLVVSDGTYWHTEETFVNAAKEADFVRNGNANAIMSLSKDDSTAYWDAVKDNNYAAYSKVHVKLLDDTAAGKARRPLRNVPLRIYIPTSPPPGKEKQEKETVAGCFQVVQSLVPPRLSNRQLQTLGTAFQTLLPTLFPSSRDPVLANVVLHGAVVPLDAPLEELMREAAYPDGWLYLVVALL